MKKMIELKVIETLIQTLSCGIFDPACVEVRGPTDDVRVLEDAPYKVSRKLSPEASAA